MALRLAEHLITFDLDSLVRLLFVFFLLFVLLELFELFSSTGSVFGFFGLLGPFSFLLLILFRELVELSDT